MTTALSSHRLALCVEYDGSAFCGWQRQGTEERAQREGCDTSNGSASNRIGVQEALEFALAAVAGVPVRTVAAGRTDTGVHASAQVIHFDAPVARPLTAWVRGVNAHLPPTVAVRWAQPVSTDFHARFSATARHYTYWLLNRSERPGLWAGRVGWYHRPLDVAAMATAAQQLVGTHDFSSFRAAQCQAQSPVKTLTTFSVMRHGAFIRFVCSGNAFLHHMVRNMMGALLWIGTGKQPVEWITELLAACDRTQAAPTFMADGLYLTGMDYDEQFGLPPTRQNVCLFDEDGCKLS
ncbi:MAG: tRNA pseudouridine(38-40) synthase TruA [Burkholderiales bacterium]|jgi:tRNA pseudouridine38-40 synthase|nr:tRNA pseudouridine(38-40) synthase TruA [Burkholderiales bacterium]